MTKESAAHPIKTHETKSICPYCGVGCGITATTLGNGSITIKGDSSHPANFGKLCALGGNLSNTLDSEGRLIYPRINGKRVAMDDALQAVADGFSEIIKKYGPDAVAFYASGQLLTEDYYLINKLMKGFIGSANIDTNSRLCMASSVSGHTRAFGSDTMPGCYEDFELADLIVTVGSNTAACHPVLYQRFLTAQKNVPQRKIVVIDPRRTRSCKAADLHLALKPGTDVILFNGLLTYLHTHNCVDNHFIRYATEGCAEALEAALATAPDIKLVAEACGLCEEDVETFYRWFSIYEKTITLFAEGVNQSSVGTDKVNAIINAHLLTGRLGKPGQGPFSLTGQPNAMGGREVGALAGQLAAHMQINNPEHRRLVQEFWKSPQIPNKPGLTAVDMFEAVHSGKIKAIWIMCTNPAVSLPDAGRVREALAKCNLVVVSDVIKKTDTTTYADILLPAAPWSEKNGTVTNSERRISRMRSFLPLTGEARPDWWLVQEVAKRMGFTQTFNFMTEADIFREHAQLSGYHNKGKRDFDISALGEISDEVYDKLTPIQWPVTESMPKGQSRMFTLGRFFTKSKKAQFLSLKYTPPKFATGKTYPFILNTGRIYSQWHTMTRTSHAPKLNAFLHEPMISIHPLDAAELEIESHYIVRLKSKWGNTLVRAELTEAQRRSEVFVPMHWTDRHASHGRINKVVNPAFDPFSHQPEMKHTPVNLKKVKMTWYGFLLSRQKIEIKVFNYWVIAKMPNCYLYEVSGLCKFEEWPQKAKSLLGQSTSQTEWIGSAGSTSVQYRLARVIDGCLDACFFVDREPIQQSRKWLISAFEKPKLPPDIREGIISGKLAK